MIDTAFLSFFTGVVTAFLWRAGGYGLKPFKKDWRRIGVPVFFFLVSLAGKASWYWVLLTSGLLFAVTCLPITLVGDDLHEKGQLWWWIPALSALHASCLAPVGIPLHPILTAILLPIVAVLQWLLIIVCHEDKNDSWAIYEIAFGAILGFAYGLLIG